MINLSKTKFKTATKPGIIVLTLMLVIASIIMVIALSLGFAGMSTDQIRLYQGYSADVFFNIDGCAEEGLARLNRNNTYGGGAITINGTVCTIGVTGTDPNRVMTIAANNNGYVKKIQIGITIFPNYIVTSWQELNN